MADDTRDTASTVASTTTSSPTKRNAKGLILGPDGKPCRSCNSFAAFSSATRPSNRSLSTSSNTLSNKPTSTLPASPPPNCPPDVASLGASSWTLLHSITASYPTTPSPQQQTDARAFLGAFSRLYPCWVCAEDFQAYMRREEVRVGSRDEFGRWMCEAHNEVNRKLGKTEFDCARWEERWRTGWKSGECD